MHDETLAGDHFKHAAFCSMCGPKFCPMQMMQNLGDLSFIEQAAEET